MTAPCKPRYSGRYSAPHVTRSTSAEIEIEIDRRGRGRGRGLDTSALLVVVVVAYEINQKKLDARDALIGVLAK